MRPDLLQALDSGKEALVVLLDFSSVFDLIDHELILHRLQNRYGIAGAVLAWVRSYLANRTQSVVVKDLLSINTPLPEVFHRVPWQDYSYSLSIVSLYRISLPVSLHIIIIIFYQNFDPLKASSAKSDKQKTKTKQNKNKHKKQIQPFEQTKTFTLILHKFSLFTYYHSQIQIADMSSL